MLPADGRLSRLEIHLGPRDAPSDAPLVCASELGYSTLAAALGTHRNRSLERCIEWMRVTTDGPFVALVDVPLAPRPLGLIQDDRSDGPPNFHESRHGRSDTVWRDFYYLTVFSLLSALDEGWRSPM